MTSSVYIHIPFCDSICSYCDFPKLCYQKKWINDYLESLDYEIKTNYKGEKIKSLYIGGGTPSALCNDELIKLFKILRIFKRTDDIEFTIECNINHITEEFLKICFDNYVNRISIGIESFNEEILKYLNRKIVKNYDYIIDLTKKYFNNINIDLMYAIPNSNIEDLREDLNKFLKLDVPHISCYSLIIEEGTILYNKKTKNIDEELDYEMYLLIDKTLKDNSYNHYEVSNYAKESYESKHNLTYWNNSHYYGFGLGASGYIENIRYSNTKNLSKYLKKDYQRKIEKVNRLLDMEYQMILGLRKEKGVSKEQFRDKYNIDIEKVYDIKKLIEEGKLISDDLCIYINPKYMYLSNEILVSFIGDNYE